MEHPHFIGVNGLILMKFLYHYTSLASFRRNCTRIFFFFFAFYILSQFCVVNQTCDYLPGMYLVESR